MMLAIISPVVRGGRSRKTAISQSISIKRMGMAKMGSRKLSMIGRCMPNPHCKNWWTTKRMDDMTNNTILKMRQKML
jgi:hypothetical protein